MNNKIYIAGMGVITPLGANAEMTHASVAAGLNIYADSTYLNTRGQPPKMALIPAEAVAIDLPNHTFHGRYSAWHQHLLKLATIAVAQAMEGYQQPHPIPIILNLPEPHDCGSKPFPVDFLEQLTIVSECNVSEQNQRLLFRGRAGGIEAIALAEKLLFERGFDNVLIGGVDSYQLPERLKTLDQNKRLAGEGVLDGFTPGEGAAFLRLSRKKEESLFAGAHLAHAQIANEPGHLYSGADYLGEGLATSVAETCKISRMPSPNTAYISANGERYWAKELGTAFIRNQPLLSADIEVRHPAEYFGDLGAASGLTLISLAAINHTSDSSTLICTSSDTALRSTVLFGEEIDEVVEQEPRDQQIARA